MHTQHKSMHSDTLCLSKPIRLSVLFDGWDLRCGRWLKCVVCLRVCVPVCLYAALHSGWSVMLNRFCHLSPHLILCVHIWQSLWHMQPKHTNTHTSTHTKFLQRLTVIKKVSGYDKQYYISNSTKDVMHFHFFVLSSWFHLLWDKNTNWINSKV